MPVVTYNDYDYDNMIMVNLAIRSDSYVFKVSDSRWAIYSTYVYKNLDENTKL